MIALVNQIHKPGSPDFLKEAQIFVPHKRFDAICSFVRMCYSISIEFFRYQVCIQAH